MKSFLTAIFNGTSISWGEIFGQSVKAGLIAFLKNILNQLENKKPNGTSN